MSQTKLISLDNLTRYDGKIKELIDQHEGSGDYSDLTNKPSINGTTLSGNKTTSDLGLFSGAYADLSGKPTLGTASGKDVPVSGDASISQVVMGNDTRLSDSRPASDVSAWAKASTKPSYTASEVGAIATTEKGANNGVAELDSTGKVPSSQLPSYVDDVLEYNSQSAFPTTGETGKIYIAKDTNKTYRWSGTAYVEISPSLALGETSSTAYAGNKGKANADAIAAIKDGSTIDSFSDVETALSNKVDKVSGKGLSTNDYTTTEKNKLSGIATGAEVNQNAFSNVTVGSTTIAADSKTDTLTIVAGDNVTLTPDATNDKLTIAATDTKYTAATSAPGNIASSGAVGTSTNYARQDHTHGIAVATGDSAGQVKVAGQNVSVNGFGNKQDKTDNSLTTTSKTVVGAINEVNNGLTNIGNATDLGNVQGSGTVTLSDSVTNYRFVQVLIGYYKSGYPCYGQALLPVSTLFISSDDIPITVPFSNRTGTTIGNVDISFLSATSVKVVNTSEPKYTRVVGIT